MKIKGKGGFYIVGGVESLWAPVKNDANKTHPESAVFPRIPCHVERRPRQRFFPMGAFGAVGDVVETTPCHKTR